MTGVHDPVRVVVVGTRGHARRVAIPTVQASPGAALVGLVGSDFERTTSLAEGMGVVAYRTVDDAIAAGDADAAWITAPSHLHANMALTFLSGGLNVLLEKPMAIDVSDAVSLVAASEASSAVLRVAYQHRFRQPHRLLRDALEQHEFGELGAMRIHRYWKFPYFPGDRPDGLAEWRRASETSGGWVVNDVGSHLVDLSLWLLAPDELSVLAAVFARQFPEIDNDSSGLLALRSHRGCIIQIDCSNRWESPGSLIEVYGTKGWARMTGSFQDLCTVESNIGLDGTFRVSSESAYLEMFGDFVGAARGRPSMGAGPLEGLAGVRVIQRARQQGCQLAT